MTHATQQQTRALADVDAKRRIVDEYADALRQAVAEYPTVGDQVRHVGAALMFACQCLAVPYADHPDYRQEWTP